MNLVNFSTLESHITKIANENAIDDRTVALCILALDRLADVTGEEAEESLVGTSQIHGVDAMYVDDRKEHITVHVLSCYYASSMDDDACFDSSKIDKVRIFMGKLLSKSLTSQECDAILWTKVTEVWDIFGEGGTPEFQVHFVSNGDSCEAEAWHELASTMRAFHSVELNQFHLDDLISLLIEGKRKRLNRTIRVVDNNYFERSDGDIRGLIASVEALSLVEMIKHENDTEEVQVAIFDDNARGYLTRRNPINKQIIASALAENNAHFWYLNNGVTMVCEHFDYSPGRRSPTVTLYDVQIVNGGQTSNALFEAYKQSPEQLKNVLLLARIYATRNRQVSGDISRSTNSQTPITSRDLHSNDEIQKKIEDTLFNHGYFYERKLNQHVVQPRDRRIDALEAGQALLAFVHEKPEVARKDRAKIFGSLYDTVFHEELDPASMLIPVQLHRRIEADKKQVLSSIKRGEPVDSNMLFLLDGVYHALNGVAYLAEASEDVLDGAEDFEPLIEKVYRVIGQMTAILRGHDETFSQSKFFKDRNTKNIIHKALARTL